MCASSRMGPRGLSLSLARTATKENCIEVKFSASEITPCCRRAKHSTNPPPPSAQKGGGYSLIWTILGCAAGQDITCDQAEF